MRSFALEYRHLHIPIDAVAPKHRLYILTYICRGLQPCPQPSISTLKPSAAFAGAFLSFPRPLVWLVTDAPYSRSSISIACWIVVFTPQIIENFRRSSADGLSLQFIIVWLAGDVFNILGAVLQGVLPTMTVLAVYYTVADIVLLGQCFWYRGFTLSDAVHEIVPVIIVDEEAVDEEQTTEHSALLPQNRPSNAPTRPSIADIDAPSKRGSFSSLHSRFSGNVDATHLSPATPFIPPPKPTDSPPAVSNTKSAIKHPLSVFIFNTTALIVVCAAGVLGWWLTSTSGRGQYPDHHHDGHHHTDEVSNTTAPLRFDLWGQIFGYLCAVLYLGSRIPQLLLNYRRKSTEGVSMLFFLFACVGNLTYVMSIFAYEPSCARVGSVGSSSGGKPHWRGGCEDGEYKEEYGRYILVNASWLIGSAGTLVLDLMIFTQFWVYRERSPKVAQLG